MDIEEVRRMQAQKDYLMRNGYYSQDIFGGTEGTDPNADQSAYEE